MVVELGCVEPVHLCRETKCSDEQGKGESYELKGGNRRKFSLTCFSSFFLVQLVHGELQILL